MRSLLRVGVLSLAMAGALAAPAPAQPNPNADQMVKSLTPTPGGGPVRGLHVRPPAAAPAVSLNVLFETGSAALTPQAIQTLEDLGRALTNPALAAYRFRIEGHTDTVGTREYNKALSGRRAIAVADYLTGRFHIDRTRLQTVGMGQDGLLVPTPDQTQEPRNRRVLVVNIGS